MAYRRPAIEVIQEFQQAAAALALPTLPACVIGPAFQIADDVEAGTYSEDELGPTTYAYDGLADGAIVDLTEPPEAEAEANAHKPVGVKLTDALLVKVPAYPVSTVVTGKLATPNLFQDLTANAFATFDPDAAGAPRFYVEIIGGAGVAAADKGRKLVIKKNSNNEIVVAAEWQSGGLPLSAVEYRILQFREEEIYPTDTFGDNGITKSADGVTIESGLRTVTDTIPMVVVEGTVSLAWRALRPDLAAALTVFTDLDSLEAVFGIGSIVPANVGPYVVNLALQNTTTEVNLTGLNADFYDAEEQAFQSALEFLENKDVYGLAALSYTAAVHQLVSSHATQLSQSSVGRERSAFINRRLTTIEVIVPPSGLGNATSAGASNGLSGTLNKTFKDPTNGAFITDHVGVGYFLEIVDYTAAAGVQRSLALNERDYYDNPNGVIQLMNGDFVVGDVGKVLITRGSTTVGNNKVYAIDAAPSATKVEVTPSPPTSEVMIASLRTWVADLSAAPAHNAADAVVAATKTWSFVNGTFTALDIGRILFIAGAATAGNNGAFIIATIVSGTSVTTVEAPAANETFGGGVTQKIYDIDREAARDITADSVNGATRVWTFIDAAFTAADVGRVLRIAGATNVGNNADHTIEAFLSSSTVRTSTATVPVTEEFNGLTTTTLTTADIRDITPSDEQDAYIKETRHKIATITSESQLALVTDPTLGFGGTLNSVEYRITRDMTLNEQADLLAGYAASFANRRLVSIWPDILAVSVNGTAKKVPGYFAGGPLVGMTAGLPSQAGFTNLTLVGFVGRENSDDRFSDTQLDTIAGGGNMILTQAVPDAALGVRHQLTTDVSTIFFQEFSVTKNVDLIARFFRGHFKPFLGIWNITDGLLDILKTRGEGGISFLLSQRQPRVGAPLRKGEMQRIEESATEPDTVEIDIGISVPLPLNNIRLKLLI